MTRPHRLIAIPLTGAALAAAVAVAVADVPLPQGDDPVTLRASDFTTTIDNPWWPMRPGTRWVYRETEGSESNRVVVRVTNRTKRIAGGIVARVIRDTATRGGDLVEDTRDYYAQDRDGNIWYLGESTKSYDEGRVSREGSWEHGVGGGLAGVAMPAEPTKGMKYRQEYLKGHAEDRAKVLSLDAKASVPFGRYRNMLQTKDYTPLEPDVFEHKYYARGIGPVLTLDLPGHKGREALISYRRG